MEGFKKMNDEWEMTTRKYLNYAEMNRFTTLITTKNYYLDSNLNFYE